MDGKEEDPEFGTRLRVLLPDTYEVFGDTVRPLSMGSAALKYGADGKVLWNEIWGSFCDLAMAGGPPHRGKLLEPSRESEEGLEQAAYQQVSQEICRGISLVTGLCAEPSPSPGWIRMYCTSAAMSGWLMRAIVMENVAATGDGLSLYLPSGSNFQIAKEVKNVITAVAKTCHYWQDHMSAAKHQEIANLLVTMERENPLVRPRLTPNPLSERAGDVSSSIAEDLHRATGLEVSRDNYADWIGFDCREISAAIWMMRALAVSNVLSRREGTIVFFPVNPAGSQAHEQSVQAVSRAHRLARAYQVLD